MLDQPTDQRRHLTLISCTYDLRERYIVDAVAAADVQHLPAEPTADVAPAGIRPDRADGIALCLAVAAGAPGVAAVAVTLRNRRDSNVRAVSMITARARVSCPVTDPKHAS